MDQARTTLPSLKASEKKYDVLYMNTPLSKMDTSTIGKVPVNDLVADDAAVFLWVDPYSTLDAASLAEKWGLKKHSVFQSVDYASYPWMKVVKSAKVEVKPELKEEAVTEETGEVKEEIKEEKPKEEKPKSKGKSKRVVRVPPIHPPSWWTSVVPENMLASRPTVEQLWLLVKGDASKLFGTSTLTTHTVNMPELGRKSKSKKPVVLSEWDTERPRVFLDTVLSTLADKSVKVLNAFGSDMHAVVDCWGPNVPGGFQESMSSTSGLVGSVSLVMKAMKKTQLQLVHSGMTKMASLDAAGKVEAMKEMGSSWEQVQKALTDYTDSGTVQYNWRNDEGVLEEWVCRFLQLLSMEHIVNFSLNHQRKKKRKSSTGASKEGKKLYGIASPSPIPPVIADFLGVPHEELMARTQIVSKINKYILENNLQCTEDRTSFSVDDKLKTIIHLEEGSTKVKYFELSGLIGKHFPKKAKKVAVKEPVAVGGPAVANTESTVAPVAEVCLRKEGETDESQCKRTKTS